MLTQPCPLRRFKVQTWCIKHGARRIQLLSPTATQIPQSSWMHGEASIEMFPQKSWAGCTAHCSQADLCTCTVPRPLSPVHLGRGLDEISRKGKLVCISTRLQNTLAVQAGRKQ